MRYIKEIKIKENSVKIHSKYPTLHCEALYLIHAAFTGSKMSPLYNKPTSVAETVKQIQNYSPFHQAAQEENTEMRSE